MARNKRIKSRGGFMFPLTADDRAQWKWMYPMTQERGPCDCECGMWGYRHRAHLIPRSRTGMVLDNVVLLIPACHRLQEKNTGQFCVLRGVDFYEKAAAHTAQWRKETGR
jgi:hypothetical protein